MSELTDTTFYRRTGGLILVGLVLALAGAAAPPPAAYAATYTLIDLGTLGGDESRALGINNLGQVVGYSDLTSDVFPIHAFLWENGVMTDLGGLGGDESAAADINDSGQVVGASTTVSGVYQDRAFLWENGVMTDLGTLGGSWSSANGLNASGQVIGNGDTAGSEIHAFVWQNGVMTDMTTLGGDFEFAMDINDSGQIVGYSHTASGDTHAFLWESGVMTDLGTLGGNYSTAKAINNTGQVVGTSDTASGEYHAFVWEDGVMTDLGTLGGDRSFGEAINDLGQVAGVSYNADSYRRAFLAVPAANTAPLVEAGPDAEVVEGGLYDGAGWFSDAESTSWSGTVDFGDGSGVQALALDGQSFTLQHLYSAPGTYRVTVQVTDDGGAVGADSLTVTVLTHQQATQDIIDQVVDLINTGSLNKGQGKALIAKLQAAIDSLDQGNPQAALHQLEAFINQVEAYVDSGVLTPEEARPLIDAARDLIALLEA